MTHHNPFGRIKAVAIGTIKDPRGAAESVAGSARGTVLLGRVVVGQVGSRFLRKPLPAETRRPAPPSPSPAPAKAPLIKAPATKAPTAPSAKAPRAPRSSTVKPEVTPADIAANIAPKAPTPTAPPTPRKAPAKKSAPGAKLPPRKATPAE